MWAKRKTLLIKIRAPPYNILLIVVSYQSWRQDLIFTYNAVLNCVSRGLCTPAFHLIPTDFRLGGLTGDDNLRVTKEVGCISPSAKGEPSRPLTILPLFFRALKRMSCCFIIIWHPLIWGGVSDFSSWSSATVYKPSMNKRQNSNRLSSAAQRYLVRMQRQFAFKMESFEVVRPIHTTDNPAVCSIGRLMIASMIVTDTPLFALRLQPLQLKFDAFLPFGFQSVVLPVFHLAYSTSSLRKS